MEADYIVVGAGSAGCVVANRLSEDKGISVILLEAGGDDRSWRFAMPLAWNQTSADPRFDWGYSSEPEHRLDNRSLPIPRGRVLGGCSSINGMMYSRGHRQDYDEWRGLGLTGWGYDEVLPFFRRAESNWRGESEAHGGRGPLGVSRLHEFGNPTGTAAIAAAERLGYSKLDDFNSGTGEGFGLPDFTVRAGMRSSTSASYLKPVAHRRNLKVLTDALATRIVVEGGRACAIELLHNDKPLQIDCRRELIISAGAINSPQLLLLSGLGPADELKQAGVKPVHDLPGVGKNLQDHPTILGSYSLKGEIGFDSELRLDRLTLSVLRWHLFKRGVAAGMPFGAQGVFRLGPETDRPDIQFILTPVAMTAQPWFPGWRAPTGHALSTIAVVLHPDSRGTVRLASANPKTPPRITLNLLESARDRALMRSLFRWTRTYLATDPLASLIDRELTPDPNIQSDDEIDAFVRASLVTSMHPVGTCAMGIGADAVVDAELRVRGIQSLRVVDASVMPRIIGGNTNAPAIMIAEKAADMIRVRKTAPQAPALKSVELPA